MTRLDPHEGASLRDHLHVLARRKWLAIVVVALVPAAAVLFSLRQPTLYEASADVLLSRQNLALALTGTQDPTLYQQADRLAQTQADLARVPEVADRTLAALGVRDRSAGEFLKASSVSVRQNADILEFKARDRDPDLAVKLATAYARQFTVYRLALDTAAIERARDEVEGRIDQLAASGDEDSPLYASLVEKEQQLGTMEALQTANAYVVRGADEAPRVQPRPVRNGLLGLALGLLLGLGAAFLVEALDTRIRTVEEIRARLGVPLLARLPRPHRRLRAKDRLATLEDPRGTQAEAFRLLRTNLDFVNLERGARTIMVTSAVQGEGKSTTIANLAVALARAGRRVVLVDLDLRRPAISRLFGLEGRPGVADAALGRLDLEQAIAWISVDSQRRDAIAGAWNGTDEIALAVLPAGSIPPDAGEFVATRTLGRLLHGLRERADVVLVDAPPLLTVGDALTLSARVDALLVVARLKTLRRGSLAELKRVLASSPAEVLGFVATDADADGGYGYGYGYGDAGETRLVSPRGEHELVGGPRA